MSSRISVHDRVMALDRLDAIGHELNAIAAWLADDPDCEDKADDLNGHAKGVLAVAWRLERPLRAQIPPERWHGTASPLPPGR